MPETQRRTADGAASFSVTAFFFRAPATSSCPVRRRGEASMRGGGLLRADPGSCSRICWGGWAWSCWVREQPEHGAGGRGADCLRGQRRRGGRHGAGRRAAGRQSAGRARDGEVRPSEVAGMARPARGRAARVGEARAGEVVGKLRADEGQQIYCASSGRQIHGCRWLRVRHYQLLGSILLSFAVGCWWMRAKALH
ncbi:hypothetical protein BRADI_5g24096v3 [Brachypodium distachyon]|uniref:Uncharacterized protein n=1 Tax=Brachypodium distachyon TaxID=15368 RepID=A0A0Q3IFJ8_BRADI|nr:hypothetical protein BRADI_5g24096v3 [Brachypodium distachyon]